jgi:hypothetical protein
MSSISSIGSSISNFFSTITTSSTSSSSSAEESQSTNDGAQGYLGDVLGITQTSAGIMGLPTAGAPGDAEMLLAEIELKLQKTVTQTRNNSALSASIAADMQAIAGQVLAINGFEKAIDADNSTVTSDTDSLNNTYLPEQAADLTAKTTADQNLTNAQNSISNAQKQQGTDNTDIAAKQKDEAAQLAIINNSKSTTSQVQAAQNQYYADAGAISNDQYDRDITQQNTINQEANAINGVNGQPGLQTVATNADNAYTVVSAEVKQLQSDIKTATSDLTTQANNIATADTTILSIMADLAQKLSVAALGNRSIGDQENDVDAQDWMINRQFDKVSDELKRLVDVDTMAQRVQGANPGQSLDQQAIDRSLLTAAGLAGSVLDLVNTLSNITPAPDADAGSQSFATGGSRLKIGL